jgi:heptose I phosphotransferase
MPANSSRAPESPIETSFSFEPWDDGRMEVNRKFGLILRANGLTSCAAVFDWSGGESVRRIGARETTRIELRTPDGPMAFYLKRHGPPRWKERVIPLLRLATPIVGARNEWEAIQRFAEAGIPTMTPVAFGMLGSRSFLITQAIEARCNLLEWAEGSAALQSGSNSSTKRSPTVGELVPRIAAIARRMHAAGLHHQDFYLNHMLLCAEDDVRVIDLGRARQQRRLGRRWIIKDLAQLDFSARHLSCRDRLRFLRLYLGRRLERRDRRMIRTITFKSQRIAAHTAKHGL